MKNNNLIKKIECIVLVLLLFCLVQVLAEPCGDVNSDEAIDIVDALLIAQHYVGSNPENFDEPAGDVNNDGMADILDALLVAQFYVGLIPALPGCDETPTPTPDPTLVPTVDPECPYVGPPGYYCCADEGESVTFDMVVNVAYGADGSFNYLYEVTGTITFDNDTFGDPIYGVEKHGFYQETGSPTPTPEPTPTNDPNQTPEPDEWAAIRAFRELKYGMFIHYSLSTFDGKEQTPGNTTSVDIYQPTDLDVDQWIQVAKDAGMKYAVLTAKHSSGFCLWDSKVQWKGKEFDYDVGASPVKTDVVAEFMTACNNHGIMPGIYYCAMDTRHSDSSIQWTPSLPYVSQEYFQLMQDHLTELHTNYPDIAIQWIDIPRHLTSGERTTLYNLVKNINPQCLVEYNYGQESRDVSTYTIAVAKKVSWPTDILNSEKTPIDNPFQVQQEDNGKTYELAYEHCISISNYWFWKSNESLKSASNLRDIRQQTWNLNGNFLLNVPPNRAGHIPDASIQRLNEIK